MDTYVFLTYTLYSCTGAPSYIKNKKEWLEKRGWKVIAFDVNRNYSNSNEISFFELQNFKNNKIEELEFHPSWLSLKRRNKVLDRIINDIGEIGKNKIVIESNTERTSEWGEILAKRIGAKHIVYLLGEDAVIKDCQSFYFFDFKNRNNELFSISKKAFKLLFSKYVNIDQDKLKYWNANSSIPPQDIKFPELESIRKADFTICHFGRKKTYINNMYDELSRFFSQYHNRTFNLILFGYKDDVVIKRFSIYKNLKIYMIDEHFPIPKSIFRKSDVVIATAGCAAISFREGAFTISMNVETLRPLGILGYTTNQISYSIDNEKFPKEDLFTLLKYVLIDKKYEKINPLFNLETKDHGYDYQLSLIDNSSKMITYYDEILKIKGNMTFRKIFMVFLLKIGLVHFVSNLKYCFHNLFIR